MPNEQIPLSEEGKALAVSKRNIFSKVGWFDDRFFFCPEDIALSDTLNKLGYKYYVKVDVSIIHYEGLVDHFLCFDCD